MKDSPITSAGILLGVLVVLSIRPVAKVDRALNLAFAPVRLVAELAAPLGWARGARYRRENAAFAASQELDEAAGVAVMLELEQNAMPFRASLREGRVFVTGLAGTRVRDKKDSVYLGLRDLTGIQVGYPVVYGDRFVGRVAKIESKKARVIVDLVTGSEFFVGATVRGEEGELEGRAGRRLDLIVGGVDSDRGGPDYLAVHNPSVREFRPGLVEVREPNLFAESAAHLADGYLLGRLTRLLGQDGPWSIEPLLNFESGLFHLVVVLPDSTLREAEVAPLGSLRDGNWRQARLLSRGDPEPGLSGVVIGLGELQGLEQGAAVIAGARLLGRVDTGRAASPLTSRVELLAEPGLMINAVARIDEGDHEGESRVLGRLISLGARDNGIAFQWKAAVRLDGKRSDTEIQDEKGLQATLFTGMGLEGVPGGLYIGRATLPLATGIHEILLTDSTHGGMPSRLFVRVAPEQREVAK